MAPGPGDGNEPALGAPEPFPPFGVHDTERIYDSDWCGLRRDIVVLPDGRHQEYHVFEVGDAAVVVPVLADGSLVLIGQYRYVHGETHWEVPAGRIGEDEAPEDAARRELLEETGFAAGRIVPLPGFYPMNGITAHYAHAFCALDCERVREPEHEPAEQITVRVVSRSQAEELLRSGRIQDGFTALALFHYLNGEGGG